VACGGAIVGGVTLAVLLLGQPAAAHAVLIESQPANGATLAQAPDTVVLRFSEDVAAGRSSARLVDGAGRDVAGARTTVDRVDRRRLIVALPRLPVGAYGVAWQVLADNDGHRTGGLVVFNVGPTAPAVTAAGDGTGARPLDVALRWLRLCLLGGLIGGLAVAGLVLGRAASAHPVTAPGIGAASADPAAPLAVAIRSARNRTLAFAAACAVLGALVGVADLAREAGRWPVPGGSQAAVVHLLTATRWGHLWIARETTLACLAALVLMLRSAAHLPDRRVGHLVRWPTVGGLVLTAVSVEALGSHAAAVSSGRTPAVVAHALHTLTACVWLGAVAALAVLIWPGTDAGRGALIRACRGPFTRLAILSVGLVAVTGLYNAGRHVESVDALVTTAYGRALLVKSALLLMAGGLGLANAARLHGRGPAWWRRSARGAAPRAPLRRLLAVEAVVGVLLLLVVAVLAESPPAPQRMTDAAAPAATVTRTGSAADLVVSVSMTPNGPGVATFTVLATSTRRPPPAPIDDVALEIATEGATTSVPLAQIAPGRYLGTGDLDAGSPVRLAAVVHRAGTRLAVAVGWSVTPPAAAQPPPDPRRRLAPIVDGMAMTLLGTGLATGVWWLATARSRRRGQWRANS
jgi:copper transport protein